MGMGCGGASLGGVMVYLGLFPWLVLGDGCARAGMVV